MLTASFIADCFVNFNVFNGFSDVFFSWQFKNTILGNQKYKS